MYVPGEDFAVENDGLPKCTERRRKLRERMADLIERAREEPHAWIIFTADVGLRADAVIFVFNGSLSEIRKSFSRVLGRAGQHEANGMKEAHLRLLKLMACGQTQGLADVAQQHVGEIHVRGLLRESLGDGLFN